MKNIKHYLYQILLIVVMVLAYPIFLPMLVIHYLLVDPLDRFIVYLKIKVLQTK